MKKILLLGNSGAGKSTLASALSLKMDIPHLHLDTIVYQNDWHQNEFPVIEKQINDFLVNEQWIIDGNYLNRAIKRFEDCDTIFFLDLNRFVCFFSVIHRYFAYKGKPRESRSDLCDEKITFSYLNWVLFGFYHSSRKKIKELCEKKGKKIIVFKTRKQIKKYMEGFVK